LDEVFRRGHEVFVGKVRSTECRWDAQRKMIWTYVTFDVLEVWSGEKAGQKTLRVAGGTVDGRTIEVTHTPHFEVGGTYVLSALDPARAYASPIVGTEQGLFREVKEETSGRMVLVDADGRCLERAPNGVLFRGRRTIPALTPSLVRFSAEPELRPGGGEEEKAPTRISPPVYRDAEGNVVKAPRSRLKPSPTRTLTLRGEPVDREVLREFARSSREPRPAR
ncbi:MAG: hypothetical protein ACM3JH_16685, partial [Acidithiobacillales bacterium]